MTPFIIFYTILGTGSVTQYLIVILIKHDFTMHILYNVCKFNKYFLKSDFSAVNYANINVTQICTCANVSILQGFVYENSKFFLYSK